MMPPGAKNLLIINLIVWLLMAIAPAGREAQIMNWCSLHYMGSSGFNAAQLFTYFFMPTNFIAVFFNMLMLFFLGPQIEWAVGTKRFVFYYLSCGVGAGLIYELSAILMMNHYAGMLPQELLADDPLLGKMLMIETSTVRGADSAVLGLILAYGVLFAERTVQLIFPPIPLKAKYIAIICVLFELLPVLQSPQYIMLHLAPLGGIAVGFGITLYWKKKLHL